MGEGRRQRFFDTRFFLYLLGTSAWIAFTSFSISSYPLAVFADGSLFVRIFEIGCFSLSFFLIGFLDHFIGPFERYSLVVSTALSLGLYLVIITSCSLFGLDQAFQYVSAACLAFGGASGYCQWLRMLALQGYRKAQWLLALGSVIPTAMLFVFDAVPDIDIRTFIIFAILAMLSILLLAVNTGINETGDDGRKAQPSPEPIRALGKDILLPLVCAMALVLITPIVSTTFSSPEGGSPSSSTILPLAHSCSLVLLLVIWFALKRDLTLPQLYCVFLPVFASLFFLISLFAPNLSWVILFIGDGSFFLVSILMVTTCLSLSRKHHFSAITLYGIFAGCVYFSNVIQLTLELLFRNGSIDLEPYAAALLLLYVLVIPAFFIVTMNRNRKARSSEAGAGHDATPSSTESACSRIASSYHLSGRQTEVLGLLALGRDVTYIAEVLFLSPNTIRSYRKDLYAAMGIHSKRELIDMVEAERSRITPAGIDVEQ